MLFVQLMSGFCETGAWRIFLLGRFKQGVSTGGLGCMTEGYGPGMLGGVIWQETGWWEPWMLNLDSLTG